MRRKEIPKEDKRITAVKKILFAIQDLEAIYPNCMAYTHRAKEPLKSLLGALLVSEEFKKRKARK